LTDDSATTAIHIPKADLGLFVAVERANRDGGRLSVSEVTRDLVEQHRSALEAEAEATGRAPTRGGSASAAPPRYHWSIINP
jgi:hypothetical protein